MNEHLTDLVLLLLPPGSVQCLDHGLVNISTSPITTHTTNTDPSTELTINVVTFFCISKKNNMLLFLLHLRYNERYNIDFYSNMKFNKKYSYCMLFINSFVTNIFHNWSSICRIFYRIFHDILTFLSSILVSIMSIESIRRSETSAVSSIRCWGSSTSDGSSVPSITRRSRLLAAISNSEEWFLSVNPFEIWWHFSCIIYRKCRRTPIK